MPALCPARTLRQAFVTSLAACLAACVFSVHAQAPPNNPTPDIVTISVPGMGLFGADAKMVTQVFKPAGEGPFPVVLFSHGRAGDVTTRTQLKNPVGTGHVRYWQAKGYAVVAPIRPGYGDTGGSDTERSGNVYGATGQCQGLPDPSITATAAMRSTTVALLWVREQSWANKDRILLEGQSVGGLTTVAMCATSPPGVVGCINFAGGTGGNPDLAPGRMCSPERTTELMQLYGSTTKLPNIWLYAVNDLFWGEQAPKDWHAAYAAGGSPTQLVSTEAVPVDGHRLLASGGKLWSEPLNVWLKKNGF
jgi:dienelactone hydrolase